MEEKYYRVGKIVNTQGLKGDVRVMASTDFPEERFKDGSQLVVMDDDEQKIAEVTIDRHYKHKSFDIVHFRGYNTIEDVEDFKNDYLGVAESLRQEELPEGEYYFDQIIGLEVYTLEGKYVGKIKTITQLGPNDVWTVERPKGKDALIPYIDDVVKEVNLEEGKVTIDALEGLLDD